MVEAAASFFLCLALVGDVPGLAAGDGDCASNEITENEINVITRLINLFIVQS